MKFLKMSINNLVVHTCDFNIWEKLRQKEDCEFEASMGYTVKILSKVGEEQVEKNNFMFRKH